MTGTLISKWLAQLADMAIRSVLFILPVTLVAYWCEVQPSWKLFAFACFWSFWSGVVFHEKEPARENDRQPAIERKVETLTPAQVAAEARKSTRAALTS